VTVRPVSFALCLTILIMTLVNIFACLKQVKGNKLFIGEKRYWTFLVILVIFSVVAENDVRNKVLPRAGCCWHYMQKRERFL